MIVALSVLTAASIGAIVWLVLRYREAESRLKVAAAGWAQALDRASNPETLSVYIRGRYVGTVRDLADFYMERERSMSGPHGKEAN